MIVTHSCKAMDIDGGEINVEVNPQVMAQHSVRNKPEGVVEKKKEIISESGKKVRHPSHQP